MTGLDADDKARIDKLVAELENIKANPPAWDELVQYEKDYLIDWDQRTRRQSKYK